MFTKGQLIKATSKVSDKLDNDPFHVIFSPWDTKDPVIFLGADSEGDIVVTLPEYLTEEMLKDRSQKGFDEFMMDDETDVMILRFPATSEFWEAVE